MIRSSLLIVAVLALTGLGSESSKKPLNVLYVAPCLSGHFTPSSQIIRALVRKGHFVDVVLLDKCCESKSDRIRGVRSCNDDEIAMGEISEELKSDNQLQALLDIGNWVSHGGTIGSFKVTHKALEKSKYDVVVHDWLQVGANLAASLHNVPAVTNYIGPLYPVTTRRNHSLYHLPMYLPDSILPYFSQKLISYFAYAAYEYSSSRLWFANIQQLSKDHGLAPLPDYANSGQLPVSYIFGRTLLLSHGPNDINTLDEYENKQNLNINPIGYVADETEFQPLSDGVVRSYIEGCGRPLVYISMGTVFEIDLKKLEVLMHALEAQPEFCFIWALKSNHYKHLVTLTEKTSSLLLLTNAPQSSILMHEKVSVFVTHAGGNSMQEGIYSLTPMLVFPGLADQPFNARQLVENQLALPLVEFTYEEITKKLRVISQDDRHAEIKKKLKGCKDRMMELGGAEKGVEIIERVAAAELKPDLTTEKYVYNLRGETFRKVLIVLGSLVLFAVAVMYLLCCLCCKKAKPKSE